MTYPIIKPAPPPPPPPPRGLPVIPEPTWFDRLLHMGPWLMIAFIAGALFGAAFLA